MRIQRQNSHCPMHTHFTALTVMVLAILPVLTAAPVAGEADLVEVKKIWDAAPHNAFTDLVRYRDEWFCVFREGAAHVSLEGALRVIVSPEGSKWNSAALITSTEGDLRDAKITITPSGKLMLSG